MKASTLVTALYPPAVRERWGAELSQAVSQAGIRSWPDALAAAVRLWLHPSDWPETTAGQTRRVLAVAVFAVAAVTALLLRATRPSAAVTADLRHPATSLWLAPILLGISLAAPIPPMRWDALHRVITEAARVLAAPATAVLAMFFAVHSGMVEHPTGMVHAALIVYYWATLAYIAQRLCTLTAHIVHTTTTPTTRRLRLALLFVGSGLALATGQSLLAVVRSAPDVGSITVTLVLGVAAVATIRAAYDLHASTT